MPWHPARRPAPSLHDRIARRAAPSARLNAATTGQLLQPAFSSCGPAQPSARAPQKPRVVVCAAAQLTFINPPGGPEPGPTYFDGTPICSGPSPCPSLRCGAFDPSLARLMRLAPRRPVMWAGVTLSRRRLSKRRQHGPTKSVPASGWGSIRHCGGPPTLMCRQSCAKKAEQSSPPARCRCYGSIDLARLL